MSKKISQIIWRVMWSLGIKDTAFGKALFVTAWLVTIGFAFTVLPFMLGFWLVFVIKENVKSTNLKFGLSAAVVAIAFLFGIPWAGAIYNPGPATPKVNVEEKKETTSTVTPIKTEPKIETKEESKTETVAFATSTKDDPTLEKGQTKVQQEGKDGAKEIKYRVTYTDGTETTREKISETITLQSVNKIISNGTKVAAVQPAPVQTTAPSTTTPSSPTSSTSSGDGYTNVDGNYVQSPGSDPAGASAKCRDGSYSYSQHRSGTCSGHGGVAEWL
jgi:hypothetical protein